MNDNNKWGGTPQSSDTGRPNWGGTPQSSDTGRPNWGGSPQSSDTGRPNWGGAPQSSDTGRPNWGGAPQSSNTGNVNPTATGEVPEYPVFMIEGISYRMIRVISSHSGEAKIFEIEQGGSHFALKLYRPGIKPNHDVLAKVKSLRGNGMLIDIYAHGVWKDDNTGILHDYEIMEYCSGGSLADLKPAKDEKVMKEYAARMAATLDFAHSNGILHRDVKPANFLFTDESHSRFVLTDWGLAKTLDSKGRAVTDAGRTKIYAAPEMYTYIPGTPTYVNSKADFFSMGMTLLALWMGEGLLLADETQLVKDKQEEMLPYPPKGEMSNHLLSLVKALTRRNPDVRAGFDEVVRWAKGEIIHDDAIKDFRIVFKADENLVAHNAKELGIMMWEHRELAKKYLYGPGKILKKLLTDVDQSALATTIEDIVEIRFPGNQDAGLFAACLALNPDTLYEGIDGKPIATQKEIARELYDNSEAYRKALYNKKEHPFLAYLSAKGLDDRIADFRRLIRTNGEAGVRAIAYMLDPELPYKFNISSFNALLTCDHPVVNSLKELSQWLADESVSPYLDFYKEDFLVWLANREPELAGKAKLIAENKTYGNDYKCDLILYTILPDVGFDFKPIKESKRVSPKDFAKKFMELIEDADELWFTNFVDNFDQKALHAYLTARNKYGKQISWINYCLELNSSDNKKKSGPYTLRIARLKAAAGLNGSPMPLHVGDLTLNSPADVKAANVSKLSNEEQTLIADWLTLFFQEELNADYKAKSYFNRTAEYYDFIRKYLPGCDYTMKSNSKSQKVRKARRSYTSSLTQLKVLRWLLVILGILPLALAIAGGVTLLLTKGSVEIGDTMLSIATWSGIIIGAIAGLAIAGETESLIIGGVCGLAFFCLIKFGLVFITPAVPWIILAFFLYQLIFSGILVLIQNKPQTTFKINNMNPGELGLREEMAAAFGTKNLLLGQNISSDTAEDTYARDHNINKKVRNTILKKFLWLIVVDVAAVAFCIWTYENADKTTNPSDSGDTPALLDGDFSGNVNGTPMTIGFAIKGNELDGDMQINYRSGVTKQTMHAAEVKNWPVEMVRADDPKITLTLDTAYKDAGKTVAKGTYLNSKGNRQPVEIHKKSDN